MISACQRYFSDLETRHFLVFYLLCKYRFKHYSTAQIQRYQQRRRQSVVRYAVEHSPFFRNHYRDHDLDAFASLPTVNKKLMMDNLTAYNTVGLAKEEILGFCLEVERTRDFTRRLHGLNIGMSSGTSGNKGVEMVSPREESYMKAALFARFDFPKGEKINLAFMLRVSAPAFNFDRFGHKLTYVSQLASIETIRAQLAAIDPNVLSAPPSMLKIIAGEVEAGRLAIRPKRIVSYAEVLHPDVKEYLACVFGCPVHEIYKCTEGPIAITCSHGRLHINEDLVLVEALNEDGTPTPPGQPCRRMIVTDLHKQVQPIIRYELNDIITLSAERCPCGSNFRVIERIQGRSDDLFWARNTRTGEWQFIFPDYVSRAIITSSELIDEYQVIQTSPSDVLVRIKLKDSAMQPRFEREALIANLGRLFEAYQCAAPRVEIRFEPPEINKHSDKLIRIRRSFNLEDCAG